jgi:hypothetical protein
VATGGAVAATIGSLLLPPVWYNHSAPDALLKWLNEGSGQWVPLVLNLNTPSGYLLCALAAGLAYFILGCLMIIVLLWALRPSVIEREGQSILFADLTRSTK